jgi:calcium-dependent protein kinase
MRVSVSMRVSRTLTASNKRPRSSPLCSTARRLHTELQRAITPQSPPPLDTESPLVTPSPSFSRVSNAPSVSAARLAHFGSVRRAWRPLLAKLGAVPRLQKLALETASFFTTPQEIDFHLPRDFAAKYELAELLGEGAFGRVHRVVPHMDSHTALDLAVKIIPKIRVVNLADYQALQQEGRMMVLLGGTLNVVHFFGAYEDDDNVYLVMEHCVGGDAFARLTGASSSESQAASYMADILHVVHQCHLLRILHGDLKLENFLFADTSDNSPLKLTDFGGASFLGEDEVLHDVRGTPLYTAPEVLSKSKHGYAFPSDMWSCGVILYRLLAGRFPFDGELLDERILLEELDLTSPPWPRISSQAKDLVAKLLTRDVGARLTAQQALQHPWVARPLTNVSPTPRVLDGTLVQRLQLYRSLNSFQQAAFTEIARRLPLETKEEVVVVFSELSRHGSSKVGIAELTDYIARAGYRLTDGEMRSFLSRLDLDGDGFLTLDEFCASLLDWSVIQRESPARWEQVVTQVFDSLDTDGDGRLGLEDLAGLAPFQTAQRAHHSFRGDVRRCFQHADLDGDGTIDRREFLAMLHMQLRAYEHFAQRLH